MPTPVTSEDRFDFQSWITGARPVVKQVTVYNRPDLVERLNKLAPSDEMSLGDAPRTYSSRRKAAKESPELAAARAEMEKSALTIVVRANSDEDDKAAKAAAAAAKVEPDDKDGNALYLLAQTILDVYPGPEREFDHDAPHRTLTVGEVKALRTAIREAQFAKVWVAMVAASNSAPEPMPDFSQPSSPALSTPEQ